MYPTVTFDYQGAAFLGDVRRLLREATKYCRRRSWRRNVLLRSTRTALTLRAVERLLGDAFVRRTKDGPTRRWFVYGRAPAGLEVLVAVVGGGPTRTLEDLRAPILVELVEPSLLDVEALRLATNAGTNRLERGSE